MSGPSVLVIGAPLPSADGLQLQDQGCLLGLAGTLTHALDHLAQARWDVIVLPPTLGVDGDGLRFVHTFKKRPLDTLPDRLRAVVVRHRAATFVVLPVEGTTEIAVFRGQEEPELRDRGVFAVARVILELR